MSLSRAIAMMSEPEQSEAFAAIARNAIASGVESRRQFDSRVRPILTALHKGGVDNDKLRRLQLLARQQFSAEKAKWGKATPASQEALCVAQ
jgi:hypothetical protein